MRLFFALPLADDAKERLRPVLERLRAPGLSVGRAEQLHFTLAFLGEQPSADAAIEAAATVRSLKPFEISLEGAGAFPNARRARVLWIGVNEGKAALCALAETLLSSLRSHRFALEDRAFKPHLTLARVKPGGARAAEAALLQMPAGEISRQRVDAVHLVQSVLGKGGATHTVLREFPLEGSPG